MKNLVEIRGERGGVAVKKIGLYAKILCALNVAGLIVHKERFGRIQIIGAAKVGKNE